MGRDAGGTYTLPAGNPVVTGTTIDSGWANPTMTDIEAALTDSLSRSGDGGMLVAFRFADGTVALPSLSFTSETNSGIYRAATNDVRVSIAGVDRTRWRADASNPFQFWNGTAWNNVLQEGGIATVTAAWVFSGALAIPASAVTAHVAAIDHDLTLNFIEAKHIDWSITGAENVHPDRLDASAANPQVSRIKTVNTSRANDAVLSDDPHIVGMVLKIDTVYALEGFLMFDSVPNAADLQFRFQLSQTAQESHTSYMVGFPSGASTVVMALSNLMTTTITHNVTVGSSDVGFFIKGFIKTHATVATTVDLQWAQNISNASATVLNLGSWVRLTEMG